MREIRFRIWDGIDYMSSSFSLQDIQQSKIQFTKDLAVMQFTGLKDENGKDIYEGDIVQFTYWWFDGNVAESALTGTIVYSDAVMSFQLEGVKNKEWEKFTGYESDSKYLTPFSELCFEEADFKVIGNIWETPELIK